LAQAISAQGREMLGFCKKRLGPFIIALVLLAAIALPCAALFAWFQTRGIRVTVIDSGPNPITSVIVHVTGNQHRIGDLAVGESRAVRVLPTSESHVELAFVDYLGQAQRLNAGGYFENGYRGTIEVELEHDSIKRNGCDHTQTECA